MIKDTFFSLPRFVNLCRKEVVENWKSNLLRTVLVFGVMVIVFLWNGYFEYRHVDPVHFISRYTDYDSVWRFVLHSFFFFLFGFGCLSASFTMEKMKNKTGRLSALMTPATSFEKFFSGWLISTIVFLIVFLLAFKLADYTRILVFSLIYPDLAQAMFPVNLCDLVGENRSFHVFREMYQLEFVLSLYLFVQSLFVLGSSIWPKKSFIKTFAAVVLIVLIYMVVGTFLGSLLFEQDTLYRFPLADYLNENQIFNMISVFLVFFALFNWILSYFRFKESEIIQRM
jgi:magnesium-transporting ATPase (P-type)